MDYRERDVQRLLMAIKDKDVSRRELVKRGAAVGLGSYALLGALGAVTGRNAFQARALASMLQDDPASGTYGGTLRIAEIGEPPTLDEHQTTVGVTATTGYCMYETLVTYDAEYGIAPELAESWEISEDQLTHTFHLRQGVLFHNGEEMTSADVVASLERWGQISGVGQNLFEATATLDATDEYTVTWNFTRPYGTVYVALSHNTQAPVIYPKSVIDAGSLEPNESAIGTGPYRMVEWRPDAFIRFERWEEYTPYEGGPNGYGGTKYAYPDVIEIVPVPDTSARVAGLQAGDYHWAQDVPNDNYEILRDYPGLVTTIDVPTNWPVFFLNWQSPIFQDNLPMREAVQAALNHEPLLQSAYGTEEFYVLDPGLMMTQTAWWTDAGGDRYNMNDPELARAKLEEAGYDGAPIRFMASQEYGYMYATGAPAAQQLEAVGFNVDLQTPDWATVVERRAKPEEWDMFVTGHGFVPDPSQISYVGQMNIYPGWWNSEESLALAEELLALTEFDDRYPLWEQVQEKAYTEIPAIKIGDGADISVISEDLGGWDTQFERGVKYWNLWIKE
ncbi:ABC transporter substrate-binding protein [soil metagenome]